MPPIHTPPVHTPPVHTPPVHTPPIENPSILEHPRIWYRGLYGWTRGLSNHQWTTEDVLLVIVAFILLSILVVVIMQSRKSDSPLRRTLASLTERVKRMV
jgi:hypothetical protein